MEETFAVGPPVGVALEGVRENGEGGVEGDSAGRISRSTSKGKVGAHGLKLESKRAAAGTNALKGWSKLAFDQGWR